MTTLITRGSGLLLGALLGFILQRGRFCVTGAFREVWTSGRTRWLTAYLIAIAMSSIGFFTLLQFGLVKDSDTPLTPLATTIGFPDLRSWNHPRRWLRHRNLLSRRGRVDRFLAGPDHLRSLGCHDEKGCLAPRQRWTSERE